MTKPVRKSQTVADPVGVVAIDKDYTIEALAKQIGMDVRTLRKSRSTSKYLRGKVVGGRQVMIRGEDFDRFLREEAKDAPAGHTWPTADQEA